LSPDAGDVSSATLVGGSVPPLFVISSSLAFISLIKFSISAISASISDLRVPTNVVNSSAFLSNASFVAFNAFFSASVHGGSITASANPEYFAIF